MTRIPVEARASIGRAAEAIQSSAGSIHDKVPSGLLSRPCARMETAMGGFVFGVTTTLCMLLVISMMAFGPHILEWLDRTTEQG